MGLDAAWRRRADVLSLWLDKGGDPGLSSYAGETIRAAVAEWQHEATTNPAVSPPPADLMTRVR